MSPAFLFPVRRFQAASLPLTSRVLCPAERFPVYPSLLYPNLLDLKALRLNRTLPLGVNLMIDRLLRVEVFYRALLNHRLLIPRFDKVLDLSVLAHNRTLPSPSKLIIVLDPRAVYTHQALLNPAC